MSILDIQVDVGRLGRLSHETARATARRSDRQGLDIRRIDGEIVVLGPGPIAFSMTLEAAAATCRRLNELLASASRQTPSPPPI